MGTPVRIARLWLAAGVVLTAVAVWALAQRSPRPAGPLPLAPGGTPAPVAAGAALTRPSVAGGLVITPDAPVDARALPPLPPRVFDPAPIYADNRLESELSEAEYEAQLARSQALPPAAALAPAFSALATGPQSGATFNTLGIADCCGGLGYTWPPDPVLAVGPNHLIVAVNSAFAIYDKTGARQGAVLNARQFWSGTDCGTTAADTQGNIFDPFLAYDPAADRFTVGYVALSRLSQGAAADRSYLCLAITQTADPTGSWHRYSIPVLANDGGGNLWLDFPQAAVWRDALYVSGNYFPIAGGSGQYARVYAIDKAALYTGGPADVLFQQNPTDRWGFSVFTVQPARPGAGFPATDPAHFLSLQALNCGFSCPELNVFRMVPNFVTDTFTWTRLASLPVTGVAVPVSVPQSGSSALVLANDTRLLGAHAAPDGSVYAAHTLACNVSAGGSEDCVRWYQVTNLNATPTVAQEGTIGVDNEYRFFPDLAVDGAGNMAIAYSFSSASTSISIRFAGRLAGDASGQVAADTTLHAGEAVYSNNFEASPHRWGDYTALAVDPADSCVLWYVGEFAKTRGSANGPNWGTRVGSLSFAGCSGGSSTATPTPTATRTATRTALRP